MEKKKKRGGQANLHLHYVKYRKSGEYSSIPVQQNLQKCKCFTTFCVDPAPVILQQFCTHILTLQRIVNWIGIGKKKTDYFYWRYLLASVWGLKSLRTLCFLEEACCVFIFLWIQQNANFKLRVQETARLVPICKAPNPTCFTVFFLSQKENSAFLALQVPPWSLKRGKCYETMFQVPPS